MPVFLLPPEIVFPHPEHADPDGLLAVASIVRAKSAKFPRPDHHRRIEDRMGLKRRFRSVSHSQRHREFGDASDTVFSKSSRMRSAKASWLMALGIALSGNGFMPVSARNSKYCKHLSSIVPQNRLPLLLLPRRQETKHAYGRRHRPGIITPEQDACENSRGAPCPVLRFALGCEKDRKGISC
ncbi:MAG: hypothetical protein HQK81_06405 [Desulfovibrionaceae bacterium]|nr:hypothetical protein [Desulfovibrionaceae bacterium]MBF0513681.1 hypothetical protein [Desulfovibrionaceae bacterium]